MKIREIVSVFGPFLLGVFAGPASAQGQLIATHNDVSAVIPASGHVPHWTNSLLVGCDSCSGAPILYTSDRQGNRQTVALDIAGSDLTSVRDVASGPDGSLAVVGLAVSGSSRMGTFIALISSDRSHQVITRVWPYAPHAVTIAPNGDVWAVGPVMNDNYRPVYANVLRHYDASGQILASTIVEGARQTNTGVYDVSSLSRLMASNDRIGWFTAACQYIEFSFDAVELGRYGCPNGNSSITQLGGVALSSADDLLVGAKRLPGPLAPLQLDRGTSTWKVVQVLQDSGKTQGLLGFDGLTLVTRADPMMRRYLWSAQPSVGQ